MCAHTLSCLPFSVLASSRPQMNSGTTARMQIQILPVPVILSPVSLPVKGGSLPCSMRYLVRCRA